MLLSDYYNNPNAEIICLIKAKQQEYFIKDYLLYKKFFFAIENDYTAYLPYKEEAKTIRKEYEMYLVPLDAF